MGGELLLIISVTSLCMLSPGPDMMLVMRNTLSGGARHGLLTSLGVLSGNLVHIAYCALGLGVLVAHSVVAYSALKYTGAAYLIFLGVSGFRNAGRTQASKAEDPTARRREAGAYFQGLLNNLLNPKGALFYLGVFTQVIRPRMPVAETALLVIAMIATSAVFWIAFVSTLHLSAVRRFLAGSRRVVERTFGILLVLLGLRVAMRD